MWSRRVILDGRWIRVDSGIGQYCYWLARTLGSVAPDLEFEVVLPELDDPFVRHLSRGVSSARLVYLAGNPYRPSGLCRLAGCESSE